MIPIRKSTLGVSMDYRCKRIDLCVILKISYSKVSYGNKKEDFVMVRIIVANLETVKGIVES